MSCIRQITWATALLNTQIPNWHAVILPLLSGSQSIVSGIICRVPKNHSLETLTKEADLQFRSVFGQPRWDVTETETLFDKVLLATNAYTSTIGKIRRSVLPVWNYQIVTEPLTDEQLD